MQKITFLPNTSMHHANPKIMDFISDFRNACDMDQIRNKYSYHIAAMLKALFKNGDIMWLFGSNKIVYMDEFNTPYTIDGIDASDGMYISESIMDPYTIDNFRFKDAIGVDGIAKRFLADMNTLNNIATELSHTAGVTISQRNAALAAIADWRVRVRLGIKTSDHTASQIFMST